MIHHAQVTQARTRPGAREWKYCVRQSMVKEEILCLLSSSHKFEKENALDGTTRENSETIVSAVPTHAIPPCHTPVPQMAPNKVTCCHPKCAGTSIRSSSANTNRRGYRWLSAGHGPMALYMTRGPLPGNTQAMTVHDAVALTNHGKTGDQEHPGSRKDVRCRNVGPICQMSVDPPGLAHWSP